MTPRFLIWPHSDHFDFVKWKSGFCQPRRWTLFLKKDHFFRVDNVLFENFLKKDHFCVYDNVFFENLFEQRPFLRVDNVFCFWKPFWKKTIFAYDYNLITFLRSNQITNMPSGQPIMPPRQPIMPKRTSYYASQITQNWRKMKKGPKGSQMRPFDDLIKPKC